MPSNAAKEWSGTLSELEQKRLTLQRQIQHYIKEQQELDSNVSRDDERQQRIQQTIETLNTAYAKVDQFLKVARPRNRRHRLCQRSQHEVSARYRYRWVYTR